MQKEMEIEASLHPGLELIITDANDNSQKQINDIHYLLSEDIDLLIVSPNEADPLSPVIDSIYRSGLPVIVIDRKISSENYSAYVGANNYEIGEEAGRYAVNLLNGKGKILEIWGLKGSSPAIERHRGFYDQIKGYPEIEIVDSLKGEWDYSKTYNLIKNNPGILDNVDLIFAHNDFMALGTHKAIKDGLIKTEIPILGIDGLPGDEGGIQAVIDDKLRATFQYPTGGFTAIEIAWKILNGLQYEKENILNTLVIDNSNAKILKMQSVQLLEMQDKIARAAEILDEQIKKYNSQQFWLRVAMISILLLLGLAYLVSRAYRKMYQANLALAEQKAEKEEQNKKLLEVSQKLEEATQAKLRFFTNISHEFRTPLTLMLGPIHDLINAGKLDENYRWRLELIDKNARRLLKLINQLMDFRKIEMEKMQVKAGEYNIVEFLRALKSDFDNLASDKKIKLSLITSIEELKVWFDPDHMDKVFFNLLSNAFKFTPDYGEIKLKLYLDQHNFGDQQKECAKIVLEDNGCGITQENLNNLFNRFYQIERGADNLEGTGIGLSLTKNLIELHNGDIEVWSEKGKGSYFNIYLQLGKEHFKESELIEEQVSTKNEIQDYIRTENTNYTSPKEKISVTEGERFKPAILIVEDHEELRNYIKQSLIQNFIVFEAGNGKEALNAIENEEIDLVITDVMMPEMDGLQLTNVIKSKIETCHIPVIMLTAKSSEDQAIEGIEHGADDYIAKPFNSKYLLARINQLIESKNRIKRYFKELGASLPVSGLSKLDRNFIHKIDEIIEENITNEQFGVELLGEKIGISRVHLYRKIKQLTELSPNDYIKSVRLKKAVKLFNEEKINISEAAYKTGFSTPSYFAKCFKDFYKQTPREYLSESKES